MHWANWTRRAFIKTSSGAGLVATIQPAAAAVFTPSERQTLVAAMDEIIPAASGMLAASKAGGLDYLERVVPSIPGLAEQFRQGLGRLDEESRRRASQPFAKLPPAERATVLESLERGGDPGFFRALRDFVYEAYYTRPEVWKLIGYESHLTDHPGPRMDPFDEAALAQVRQRGKLYREVE